MSDIYAAGPWGRPGRSRTRSGDGEGWGRDREREFLILSARGDSRRRARFAKRNPKIWIGLRLSFYEPVARPGPRQDLGLLIIENELAAISLHSKDRVTVALLVANDSNKQCLARPACLHEQAALQQHVVFTVAVAVVGIIPALDHAPMLEIGHRLDRLIDPRIDPHHVDPGLGGEDHIPRL